MLTKMPQVGDKVRALQNELDISEGTVYEVFKIDSGGDALVKDDVGDDWLIQEHVFAQYELVSEAHDAPVGLITIDNVRQTTKIRSDGSSVAGYAFTVYADADGYDAVERLTDLSAKQDKRADIERQIAALQKELAAL